MIPEPRPMNTRNNQRRPNCVVVKIDNQSPLSRLSTKPSPLIIEASSQLQTNHEMSAVKSVHQAIRQVSRWNVSSSRSVPAEGSRAAGKTITVSNRNRLASRIEADICNHRTNINASDIRIRRCAAVGNYTLPAGGIQSANVKSPAVTFVSTETVRQMTLQLLTKRAVKRTVGTEIERTFRVLGTWKAAEYLPEISRNATTQSKMPKRDRICSCPGH